MPTRSLFAMLAVLALLGPCGTGRAQQRTELKRADGTPIPVQRHGNASGCRPTLIVSHGLGGSERGLAGLAQEMAANGWRVVVMGHAESGRRALARALLSGDIRQGLITEVTNADHHRARFSDLDAVHGDATGRCRPPRLVLAGHSMGAMTTMLEAGAVARFGKFGADRFDAYVALSPQGVGVSWTETSWQAVRKPVLMVTGTRDHGLDGDYTTRAGAFDRLPPGPHRLAIVADASHRELSGSSARMGKTIARLILSRDSQVDQRIAVSL